MLALMQDSLAISAEHHLLPHCLTMTLHLRDDVERFQLRTAEEAVAVWAALHYALYSIGESRPFFPSHTLRQKAVEKCIDRLSALDIREVHMESHSPTFVVEMFVVAPVFSPESIPKLLTSVFMTMCNGGDVSSMMIERQYVRVRCTRAIAVKMGLCVPPVLAPCDTYSVMASSSSLDSEAEHRRHAIVGNESPVILDDGMSIPITPFIPPRSSLQVDHEATFSVCNTPVVDDPPSSVGGLAAAEAPPLRECPSSALRAQPSGDVLVINPSTTRMAMLCIVVTCASYAAALLAVVLNAVTFQ